MNVDTPDDDATIRFYDSDYPSATGNPYPDNMDEVTIFQGVRHDADRHVELARALATDGDVLELCCGSGRIALPLARDGHRVTAVDVSAGILRLFEAKLDREPAAVRDRITLIEQDIAELGLGRRDFALAVCGFNSLLVVGDFDRQRRALRSAANHLRPGGTLVLDLVNPLQLNLRGNPVPTPFFTRRRVDTGGRYTRFAMSDPLGDGQRQRLHGWYDEVDASGVVVRTPYEVWWRPIFRYEIELMLAEAGFAITAVEGGHRGEPFTADSPHMLIQAVRRAPDRTPLPSFAA